mmetsp:Transcript_11267/g.20381  ORF Transcript_11267/g.20381 Transcript_11267/m.20381 type:complete len:393 (-) Transcript_11267:2450-3628(-)
MSSDIKCLFAHFILLFCCIFTRNSYALDYEDRLIGWLGETARSKNAEIKMWVQTISWKPRAVVFHNFLSDAEAKHIVELSHPVMRRSQVEGPNNTGVVDDIRTSFGAFIPRYYDPVIAAIEERIALVTHLPSTHQESMQVLRYGPTNKYGAHLDGLGRLATLLMYLVEPDAGGETAFTNSVWAHPAMAASAESSKKNSGAGGASSSSSSGFSDCAKGHVAFKPRRGDALLFFDKTPDYITSDDYSMHTGCPVIQGVKWDAVKWIHGSPFRPEEIQHANTALTDHGGFASLTGSETRRLAATQLKGTPLTSDRLAKDPGLCRDSVDRCELWANMGECKKNPLFMLGDGDNPGACRAACGFCRPCGDEDTECIHENRKREGYLIFDPKETKGLF